MTEQEELEQLKQNSPYALPDDPSTSGWSTARIKEKFYAGLILLYDYFKQSRTSQNNHLDSMQQVVDAINEEYQGIINNETLKVKYDAAGNEIVTTYAKLVDIASGTVAALKYIKEGGTSEYIYQIEKDLATLTSNFNLVKEWADNIKSLSSDEAVQRAVKATKDSLGNVIKDTYATIADMQTNQSNITKILNGTLTVDKASRDQNGNVIDTTYATKAENALKVAFTDIVNALNDTSTDKPLSAYQGKVLKDSIDAINTLLASNDTDLDQLQEIVTYIKNNKNLIDGITTNKVNYTDIIDNLTSEIANKPLSAGQGYVLKGYIDAIHQTLLPSVTETYDLGSATYKYKDVYISGNLKDGTNSISVANMIQALADILTLQGASHTHANKALLDTYTQTEADLADAVGKKHSHSNKSVLDNVTQTHLDNSHTHSNKSVLDGIASTDVTNWNDKYSRTEVDAKVGNAVAIANGKTKSYVIDLTDNPSFNAVTDSITLASNTTLTCVDGTTVTLADLKEGDVILISDVDVPDRWVAQISQSNETIAYRMDSLETRKVDITPKEDKSNKATSLSSGSTDIQYPSAKCVYDQLLLKVNKTDIGYIELSGARGTLTDEQYAEALKPYCLIFLGGYCYYKEIDSDSIIWFNAVYFQTNNNTPLINSLNFQITKATKYYEIVGGFSTTVQSKLVSGTDIKTINNQSLLGSGNISIPTPQFYRHNIKVINRSYGVFEITLFNKKSTPYTINDLFSTTINENSIYGSIELDNPNFYFQSDINNCFGVTLQDEMYISFYLYCDTEEDDPYIAVETRNSQDDWYYDDITEFTDIVKQL